MKRFLYLAIALLLVWALVERDQPASPAAPANAPAAVSLSTPVAADDTADLLARAFKERRSGILVSGRGVVERILADDNDGSRHQRFILRLAGGQTLLVAHNIDLAPRIAGLETGDTVAFRGEYEWNPQGGVIHWTHHDPQERHPGGWLEHEGRRYR